MTYNCNILEICIVRVSYYFVCCRPKEKKDIEEWGMLELQGDLETRHPVPLGGKFIGDLHFTQKVHYNYYNQSGVLLK